MPFAMTQKEDYAGPDDKVVLDPKTNTTVAFPSSMSDDEINHHMQNDFRQSPVNPENVQKWNPDFYTREYRPALEGKNLYDPSFISAAFLKNAASMASFGAYKPDAETQAMFKQFAPTATMAGQMAGFAVPSVVLGGVNRVIGGLLTKIPAVGGLLGSVSPKIAQSAAASANAGATMGEYTGISEGIDQSKEGNIDFGKIGQDVLKQTAMWGAGGAITGYLAKPLQALHGAEKWGEYSKQVATSSGVMAAITKANGGDDKDSILASGLAGVFHMVSAFPEVAHNKEALQDVQKLMTSYVSAKNGIMNKADAYAVAQAHILNEAEQVVEAYKEPSSGATPSGRVSQPDLKGDTLNGLPITGIETPQAKAIEESALEKIAQDPHMTQQVIGAMAQRVARGNDESFTLGGFFPGGELFKAVYDKFFPKNDLEGKEDQKESEPQRIEEQGKSNKEPLLTQQEPQKLPEQSSGDVLEETPSQQWTSPKSGNKQEEDQTGFSLNENIAQDQPKGKLYEQGNKYVLNEPLDIKDSGNDKLTAKDTREKYTGNKHAQIVRGTHLSEEIKRLVPSKKERQGMFWYAAAKGDVELLKSYADDPKFEEYKDQILAGTELSDNAKKAVDMGSKYYQEAGQVAQELGTIRGVRDNYQDRIYEPEKEDQKVSNETKSGIQQTTKHAKSRVYDTEFDAVEGGKKFALTDYADSLSIHNEEMARVNTARKLADTMSDKNTGLGKWVRPDNIPEGWQQVGRLQKSVPIRDKNGEALIGEDGNQVYSHSVFVAPKVISEGLRAIVDPDHIKKVDFLRDLQKYQGLVKSIDLSFSLFHHLTFVTQTLASAEGWKTMADAPKMFKTLDSPEFRDMEKDFVEHTGMTSAIEANQDIFKELNKGNDFIAKLGKMPVAKQIFKTIEANNNFLFGKMQRYMKVMTYQRNVADWVNKNLNAENEAVYKAKQGFAKAVNAEFGGLNWEAMGVGKSAQSALRLALLAPDWFVSALSQTKYVFEKGTAGQLARGTLLKATIGGIVSTEVLNKIITGHFTDKNKKGHLFELQAAPNMYVSLIRGAPGELVKFVSNVWESGGQGVTRYLQGKFGPALRTLLTSLPGGTNYQGRPTWEGKSAGEKTINGLINIIASAAPVPFGISSITQYEKSGETTPAGTVLASTGLGRYSTTSEDQLEKESAQELQVASDKGDQGKIDQLVADGKVSDDQVEKAQKLSEMSPAERATHSMRVDKLIDYMLDHPNSREELNGIMEDKFSRAIDRASEKRKEYLNKKYNAYQRKVSK